MRDSKATSTTEQIRDLELVDWVDEEPSLRGMALKDGLRVREPYKSFRKLYDAIIEHGPLLYATSSADAIFVAASEPFDGDILAIRHSGRNVRRFLIREDHFEGQYGSFSNCLDHILSNNAVDCEIELEHLFDLADKLQLSPSKIDPKRDYSKLEVDIVAALQLIRTMEKVSGNEGEYTPEFEIGYCVGRLFSSAQNFATLEPDALKAREYEKSYKERGKKGKSRDRKEARLDHLFECMKHLIQQNPALSRLKPLDVARLACQDAASQNPKLWTQGRGQLEHYLTCFASESKYRKAYYELFPETG